MAVPLLETEIGEGLHMVDLSLMIGLGINLSITMSLEFPLVFQEGLLNVGGRQREILDPTGRRRPTVRKKKKAAE